MFDIVRPHRPQQSHFAMPQTSQSFMDYSKSGRHMGQPGAYNPYARKPRKWGLTLALAGAFVAVFAIVGVFVWQFMLAPQGTGGGLGDGRIRYADVVRVPDDVISTPIENVYTFKGEIIMMAYDGTPFEAVERLVEEHGGEWVSYIEPINFYHARFPFDTFEEAYALSEVLAANPIIQVALPDLVFPFEGASMEVVSTRDGDFILDRTWGQRVIEMYEAHDLLKGRLLYTVTVGVMDDSIDYEHIYLDIYAGQLIGGRCAIHGTSVTGVIAAIDSGSGFRGVSLDHSLLFASLDSPLIPTLVGTSRTIINLHWLANNGARVINLSFGFPGLDSGFLNVRPLRESFEKAMAIALLEIILRLDLNALFVAAAGNSSAAAHELHTFTRLAYRFPALRPNIISVGSINPDWNISFFSNFGEYVDIVAPGMLIYSTLPGNITGFGTPGDEGINFNAGTSYSSPFVAGAAALIWSINPDFTASQVRNIIIEASRQERTVSHTVNGTTYTYPVLNVRAAVEMALAMLPDYPGASPPPADAPGIAEPPPAVAPPPPSGSPPPADTPLPPTAPVSPPVGPPAAPATDWNLAFIDVLEVNRSVILAYEAYLADGGYVSLHQWGENRDNFFLESGWFPSTLLFDINEDGIPELFFMGLSNNRWGEYIFLTVYQMMDDQAVRIFRQQTNLNSWARNQMKVSWRYRDSRSDGVVRFNRVTQFVPRSYRYEGNGFVFLLEHDGVARLNYVYLFSNMPGYITTDRRAMSHLYPHTLLIGENFDDVLQFLHRQ